MLWMEKVPERNIFLVNNATSQEEKLSPLYIKLQLLFETLTLTFMQLLIFLSLSYRTPDGRQSKLTYDILMIMKKTAIVSMGSMRMKFS